MATMLIITKSTVSEVGRCNLCARQPKIVVEEDSQETAWTIRSKDRARTSVISICDDCRKELILGFVKGE